MGDEEDAIREDGRIGNRAVVTEGRHKVTCRRDASRKHRT